MGVAIISTLISWCFGGINVYAAEENAIINSRAYKDYTDIFFQSDAGQIVSVQVGNLHYDDASEGRVATADAPIRTIIILDNSISFGKKWGEEAKNLIKQIAAAHSADETIAIYTVSEELTEICAKTSDYDSIVDIVDSIEFNDQATYLSEAIYELLPVLTANEDGFVRLVIITDGADDNDISYTSSEMLELIKKSGVVIHTVGLKNGKNSELLETLFSYSRASGGSYTAVDTDSTYDTVLEAIDRDYELSYLRIYPDSSVADGSIQQARIVFAGAEGEREYTASVQMPFEGKVGEIVDDKEEDEKGSAEVADDGLPRVSLETSESKEEEKSPVLVWVVLAIVAVIGILLFALIKRRKKSLPQSVEDKVEPDQDAESCTTEVDEQDDGATVILRAENDDSCETVPILWRRSANKEKHVTVKLVDIDNTNRHFTAILYDEITIGRREGNIIIADDKAVSGKHLKMTLQGEKIYIQDLNSSNGTFLEGHRIEGETEITDGDEISIGNHTYRINAELKEG